MVCAANHEDAIVAPKPIHFVEEVASNHWANESVEVLENEITGCKLSSLSKDGLDAILRSSVLR